MSIREALAGPLAGMAAYKQFIIYRLQPSTSRPGKTDKLPCDIAGRTVNSQDPSVWMDAATAVAVAEMYGPEYGVGFVLTAADPFWFLDSDSSLVDGAWSPLAVSISTQLAGCAAEISKSNVGLHWFGTGTMPAHGCRNQALGLELYHQGRFVALTGTGAVGNCLTDASAVLPALVATYFPPDTESLNETGWTDSAVPEWKGPATDEELIRRAMLSKSTASAFGHRASFADLWLANESALALSYPDAGGRPYDASAADAALAQHLAFWTGCDCERIARLMRASGLARDKYDREDYLPRTILKAIARQGDVCVDKQPAVALVDAAGSPVAAVSASLTVPSGLASEVTPNDFWAVLPNHNYVNRVTRAFLSVEAVNGHLKRFTDQLGMKPAAWLDMMRAVQQMSWHPGQPEIIEGMVSDKGELRPDPKGRIYNLYRPSDAVATDADASPWLNHVRLLYPDDYEHLLKWFAFRIQFPGEKLNHALLIGGAQGVGKDLMLEPIRYAVGTHNVAEVNPPDLFKDFTQWVECTLLVINEARNLGDESKYAFYESSKRFIAAPPNTLRCNKKHLQEYDVPNVMGVCITSNNKLNGLHIDPDDRRHYVAWSAATKQGGDYYSDLVKWMDEGGGKQAVTGYLQRLALNGWNAKEPPPRTEAWHQIVTSGGNPEDSGLADAIEGLKIATVREIIAKLQFTGQLELATTLGKAGRKIPMMLERIGFEPLINPNAKKDGRWRLGDGRKDTLYVDKSIPHAEQLMLAARKVSGT